MKRSRQWLVVVAFCLTCSNAMATLAIAGSVAIAPDAKFLLRGQTASLTYTITNIGDEPLEEASAGTFYFGWGPSSTIFPSGTAATAPCIMTFFDLSPVPGQAPAVINTVFFRPTPVLPGETRECVLEISVSQEAGGPFTQQFGITGSRGNQSTTVSQFIFFPLGQVAAVPTASLFAWMALVLSVMFSGTLIARRRIARSYLARWR